MSRRETPETKLRKDLTSLTRAVREFLAIMDEEMKGPSTVERGRRIAALCNALQMVNDRVRYFGLGVDYRTDKPVHAIAKRRVLRSLDAALVGAARDPGGDRR